MRIALRPSANASRTAVGDLCSDVLRRQMRGCLLHLPLGHADTGDARDRATDEPGHSLDHADLRSLRRRRRTARVVPVASAAVLIIGVLSAARGDTAAAGDRTADRLGRSEHAIEPLEVVAGLGHRRPWLRRSTHAARRATARFPRATTRPRRAATASCRALAPARRSAPRTRCSTAPPPGRSASSPAVMLRSSIRLATSASAPCSLGS